MRIQSLSLVSAIMLLSSFAFGQIEFEQGSWKEIKAKAKSEDKAIFVDAFTDWCGPCKWMAANLFPDEAVGHFFNDNFVCYQLDQEKGEGPEFAKTFGVRAYPTLLFFDASGELVHKGVGTPQTGEALISLGQDALNPEKQLISMMDEYEEGRIDPEFLYNYAMALQTAYEPTEEVATQYLEHIPKEKWGEKDNWTFITQMINSYRSDVFQEIIQNKDMFSQEVGMEVVNEYIESVMNQAVYSVARSRSEEQLQSFKNQLIQIAPEQVEYYTAKVNYLFYSRDKEKRHPYALAYFDGFDVSSQELNGIAWNYFETEEDPQKLADALRWVNHSIQLDETWPNTDTKANLLFKLKRYQEASEVATKSIAIGREADEDVADTEKLLEEIQAKLAMGDRAD